MSDNSNSSTLEPDDLEFVVLIDRYITIKKLDKGAYATVYIAYDTVASKYCAIKIHNEENYKIGKRESKIYDVLKKYKSQYIMSPYHNFDHEIDETLYHCSVMDLMASSVYNVLTTTKYEKGLSFQNVLTITEQILRALIPIHNDKIIHGDIKPENMLICGNSISQTELFNKINIQELIKNVRIESKLETLKNRNKNRKNNKKFDQSFNNDKLDLEKLCEKIKLQISDLHSTTLSDNNVKNISNTCSSNSDSTYVSDCNNQITVSSENSHNSSDSEISEVNITENKMNSDTSDASHSDNSVNSFESVYSTESGASRKSTIIDPKILDNVKVKLSDMGGCLLPNKSQKNIHQTSYYKSPEILFSLNYDTSSDIWALGCSIYELLTGDILFDSHYNKGNERRHHIYLMTKKIGVIPPYVFEKSPLKDVFFTSDCKLIKGYKSIDFTKSIWSDIENSLLLQNIDDQKINCFIDFMKQLLEYDSSKRFTAINALKHPIFNN